MQWVNNATDICTGNVVRGNTISTYGNECVDIKEGSTQNLVEENTCSDQLDEESGCYDSRGDNNTIRCDEFLNAHQGPVCNEISLIHSISAFQLDVVEMVFITLRVRVTFTTL